MAEVVTVPLTELDRELLDEIRRSGSFLSDADAVRSALWSLARHLQLDPPIEAFALESRRRHARRATA